MSGTSEALDYIKKPCEEVRARAPVQPKKRRSAGAHAVATAVAADTSVSAPHALNGVALCASRACVRSLCATRGAS